MERLRPYFPKSRGRARVDDSRVLSEIIFINLNDLRWFDAPAEHGPPKTPYNRWKRWSDMGVFAQILMGLSEQAPDNKTLSIDATYLKAHPLPGNACSHAREGHGIQPAVKKGVRGRLIGLTKGGMNTKLHAVTDTRGRPIRLFITAGQVSDDTGAATPMNGLPEAEWLLADRGYDADWFRNTLIDKGANPASPVASRARRPSSTTNADTNVAIASKGCSAGSKTGVASQLDTTDQRRIPFRHRARRSRHILVMNPEPSVVSSQSTSRRRIHRKGIANGYAFQPYRSVGLFGRWALDSPKQTRHRNLSP